MKKYFNKDIFVNKENNQSFESSKKYKICDNTFFEGDVKVRDR